MKPIIITVNSDNKVVMSVEEFKRHMDTACSKGYSDGCSTCSITTTPYYDNNKWWKDVSCNGTTLTACLDGKIATDHVTTISDSITADSCDCVAGHCNCSAECANQTSISSYLRSKGE